MPISAYSPIRDSNASIPPGDIRSPKTEDQQIINSIRQLMADLAGFAGGTNEFIISGSVGPTPTVEGLLKWDSAKDAIVIGDGAGQAIFRQTHWERIGIPVVVSVAGASVDFTNLAAFRWLRLYVDAMPVTDGVSAIIRTSTNNGGAFDAGATDYNDGNTSFRGGVTTSQNTNTTAMFLSNTTTIGNATGEGFNSEILFMNFNQALFCRMQYVSGWLDTGGVPIGGSGSGYRLQATARDAFQFRFGAGNIAVGSTFVLEGIRG